MPPERRSTPRSPELAALGRAIEERIDEIGMSQSSLAGASGIDLRRISDYVRGQYNPSYRNMRRLCQALKLPVDELMDRAQGLQEELFGGAAEPLEGLSTRQGWPARQADQPTWNRRQRLSSDSPNGAVEQARQGSTARPQGWAGW